MPRITISYRRDDSIAITGRIYDRLVARYGRDTVFRDIDDVGIGVDFRTHIEKELRKSDAVIAVVGPHWAGPSASQSRLSNEADPVRVEIETALGRKLPLIPVLVLGAAMPSVTQLPESLKDFAYRNAVEVDAGQNFDVGMTRLITALDGILGRSAKPGRAAGETAVGPPSERRRILIGGGIAAGVFGIAVVSAAYFGLDRQKPLPPADKAAAATNVPSPPITAPAPSPPTTAPIAAPSAQLPDRETVFWQSISAGNNAADLEEYLRKYPQGRFAELARSQLVALRQSQVSALEALARGEEEYKRASYTEAERWYRLAADQGNSDAQDKIGLLYDLGRGVSENQEEALHWYRMAAGQGNAAAQFHIGFLYSNGRGVSKDFGEAARWYRKSADQGYAPAQINLGQLYKLGLGVNQDYQNAMDWFEKAAKQNVPMAEIQVGLLYEEGSGVQQDYRQALSWYRRAADVSVAPAQYLVARLYENGRGVSKNLEQARRWYTLAADQGNEDARKALTRLDGNTPPATLSVAEISAAEVFANGNAAFERKDYTEAMRWFRKAADQGNVGAQSIIGLFYERGLGVNQDYSQALSWYRKAADRGYADAQVNIGMLYERGLGVPEDAAEAMRWFRKAADQGYAMAQSNVGAHYAQALGVRRDYGEAMRWFRKAADQGYAPAQSNIGLLYASGLGVAQDLQEARRWMQKAAAGGNGAAKKWLAEH
ncbi:MAG TPA: TIR domain-containing protein [Stellaceae bacterium]|nr:TIR domain-containing protein [Stellaceae bacterium]